MIRNTNETITIADITVAMILGRPVTIDYEKADGSRTIRVVEPFEIVDREHAVKRPFFRAMDRLSHDYRTFRFDRLYAYRVSNAQGRYRVPRPAPRLVPNLVESDAPTAAANPTETSFEVSPVDPSHTPAGFAPDGLGAPDDGYDDEWGVWLESQYDPDAPVPYLPTPYALNKEK
jgi:predicted DNA-binding transcriptional regulator YafY